MRIDIKKPGECSSITQFQKNKLVVKNLSLIITFEGGKL